MSPAFAARPLPQRRPYPEAGDRARSADSAFDLALAAWREAGFPIEAEDAKPPATIPWSTLAPHAGEWVACDGAQVVRAARTLAELGDTGDLLVFRVPETPPVVWNGPDVEVGEVNR